MRVWNITNDSGHYGRVLANSFEEADKHLFWKIVKNQVPYDCIVIEEGEEQAEEVETNNILSVESQ